MTRFNLLMVAAFILIGIVVAIGFQHEQELIADCMADGHKRYECELMVRPPHQNVDVWVTR